MNISDIAKKAGVSTATVSRVLNNSSSVTPKTRELVQQVIDSEGYVPSAVARSLSVRTTSTIGVIIPDIENPFFCSALRGISEVAGRNNYNVVFFNTDETAQNEHNFLMVAQQQRLEGVIISPVNYFDTLTRSVLEDFERGGVPVVLLDRDLMGGSFSSVTAEDQIGAYNAVIRLLDEGHERIAIIRGSPSNRPVYERTFGYLKAMKERKIPVRNEYLIDADQKSDIAYKGMQKLMELPEPPTAVFTCNNRMTLGCLRYITEHGLVLGRDISLIGFDDIEILHEIDYKLSVVSRSEQGMGEIAMELLLKRLKEPETENRTVVVPTELILRGSERYLKD